MNKKLMKQNKAQLTEEEQTKLKEQFIVAELKQEQGISCNQQLALIFNILEENFDLLKDSEHKEELKNYLDIRNKAKEEFKGE